MPEPRTVVPLIVPETGPVDCPASKATVRVPVNVPPDCVKVHWMGPVLPELLLLSMEYVPLQSPVMEVGNAVSLITEIACPGVTPTPLTPMNCRAEGVTRNAPGGFAWAKTAGRPTHKQSPRNSKLIPNYLGVIVAQSVDGPAQEFICGPDSGILGASSGQ